MVYVSNLSMHELEITWILRRLTWSLEAFFFLNPWLEDKKNTGKPQEKFVLEGEKRTQEINNDRE